MLTPEFLYTPTPSLTANCLIPLSWIYRLLGHIQNKCIKTWKAPIPVICIGNLVAGGQGKTPAALSIGHILKKQKKTIHYVSRGYGGKNKGPLLVKPENHEALEVGDESLLLSRVAPTWIGSNRKSSIELAHKMGAEVIIMDEGFQNPSIHKDLSIIVVDGEMGFGNGHLIPAGPLRQDVQTGLSQSNAVVIVGEDKTNLKSNILKTYPSFDKSPFNILAAQLTPDQTPDNLKNKKIFAFTGIGYPKKFFDTLTNMGYNVVATRSFSDHHLYSDIDVSNLRDTAKLYEAGLITTSKDYVRLSQTQKENISILEIVFEWDDLNAIKKLMRSVV